MTVNQPAEQLKPDGKLPAPLAALGDRIEVRIARAPDGKGTEVAARRGGKTAPVSARKYGSRCGRRSR